ncbi:hypothetical protein E3P77_00912 [Wallemia ichthyophaga]|nr:hypothetical protein E3P77_00912 [Wallemia ichthyophaga]
MDVYTLYKQQLGTLNSNQKHLINNLTLLARQYASTPNQVADAVHDHISFLKPHYRLPVLYLIDSVCKNLAQFNYAYYFRPYIAKDWLETYNMVDGSTRSKLEELVITWRNGGPYGSNLFGEHAQLECEQRLYGNGGWKATIPLSYGPSRTLVISELQGALEKRRLHLQYYPFDDKVKSHVHALSTLEKILLTTSVPPDQLNQIYERVKSMTNDATPLVGAPGAAPGITPGISSGLASGSPPPLPTPAIISTPAPAPAPPVQPAAPIPILASQSNPLLQSLTPPPPSATPSQPGSNVSGLLQSLQASGLLKPSTTSINGSSTPASLTPQMNTTNTLSQDDDEKEKQYDQAVLALDIVLDNNDILCARPNLDKLFYDRLTIQCPQCSRRFGDTKSGKKQLGEHIDTHFRINRRNKEGSRGVTRSWLIVLRDWMNDVADDSLASQRGPMASHEDSEHAQEMEYRKKLESSTVPVPIDASDAAQLCPICKEKFKSEFSEEDEEWVWVNAIQDGDVIYHATCHNDRTVGAVDTLPASRSGSVLGKRERQGSLDDGDVAADTKKILLEDVVKMETLSRGIRMSKPFIESVENIPTNTKFLGLQTLHWKDQDGKARKWENAYRTTRSESGVDAVSIAAILKYTTERPSDIVLIKQYRPPHDTQVVEMPAGLVDAGEDIRACAIRELYEETGIRSDRITVIDETPTIANDPGMSNANMKNVTLVVDGVDADVAMPEQHLDEGEHITVQRVPLTQLHQKLLEYSEQGFIVDARLSHLALGLHIARTQQSVF